MKSIVFAALVLLGCGGKKTDYSTAKLVTQTVTVDGFSYTVDVPEGLPKDEHEPGDWSSAKVDYDYVPKVFTSVYPLEMPKTVDEAKRDVPLSPDKGTFTRAEANPGGGWVTTLATADKTRVEASSLIPVGNKIVKCHAIQVGDGEVPSFEMTKTMLEMVCRSIKAK